MSLTFGRAVPICALLLWHAGPGAAQTAVQEKPPGAAPPAVAQVPSPVPTVTAEERKAAFPDVSVPPVQDNALHAFALLDRFEWQQPRNGRGAPSWEGLGWIGHDRDRFWFRSEGDTSAGRLESAEVHAFYGRMIARWWDVLAGVRQDIRPGSPQTWAAVGIQGLAPYWFEIKATVYVGSGGRTQLRFETEYELLLTNRLILQPLVEVNVYGKRDAERKIAAGLATSEIGVRVRYMIRREFAPYVGVTWNQKHFGTAEMAKAAGEVAGSARLTVGVRMWR